MDNINPIDEVLSTAMRNIRSIADVNTVIGKPIESGDGRTIIPISKVTIGFVAGGGEYGEVNKFTPEYPFAGGSGGAVQLSPIGFLVGSREEELKMIGIDSDNSLSRMFDAAKSVFERAARSREEREEDEAQEDLQ